MYIVYNCVELFNFMGYCFCSSQHYWMCFFIHKYFFVCVCVTERVGGGVPLFTVGFAYALFLVIVVHTLP